MKAAYFIAGIVVGLGAVTLAVSLAGSLLGWWLLPLVLVLLMGIYILAVIGDKSYPGFRHASGVAVTLSVFATNGVVLVRNDANSTSGWFLSIVPVVAACLMFIPVFRRKAKAPIGIGSSNAEHSGL